MLYLPSFRCMYMAMSETISSTGPDDSWTQFYQHNNSGQAQAASGRTTTVTMFGDRASDTTVVTTTVSSSSAPSPRGSSTMNPSAAGHLNPEGRVSKPSRRQSRASRRTPTTLLNTDPTNFRAMVQQFTGGPSVPFPTGSHPSVPANFNFEPGTRQQIVNPTAVMVPPGAYHDLQLHHQQQLQQQYRHQQIMFPLNSRTTNHGHGDGFLQRLANSRPTLEMDVPANGFAMERGISYHGPPRPPS